MAGWSFAPPGIFGLTGHQLGGPAPRLSSKKRPTVRAQKLQQQRRLEKSVRDEWIAPEPVIEEVENVTVEQGLQAPASPSSAKEEEEEQDLNDPQLLDWRRDPEKPVMRLSMGSNVSARARWQVAFAKVREMTSSVRKRQHRVALGLKVKEYLMFHHLRGSCGRLTRSVDSFERGLFSDKTEKMEITYEAFSEGVVPEAENWVRKNFEEMREVLEPVVYNEQNRKYDMNELERMLRMKEQEDAWLEAQQHSTDELLQTHGRLMERSVTSLAEMVRQVRQVLSALAAEIAAGLQRHRNLKTEYDSAEHESFDLSQKQKKMMTQIEEAEARQKEAKDGYNKEVETLTQEFTKVRRATTSVKFQLAKDNSYCDRLMQEIENAMAKKMAENAKVMAEEHIKRIKRKWDVHQREKIMRQATYEKELRELREKLAKRQAYLEERRVFLEVSLCRSKTTQAKLLLFELQARTQEMQNAAPAQRKTIKRLFSSSSLSSSQSIPKPQQGLLLLLGEELYLQRQWLTERGQYLEVDAKSFEIRGPPLLGTPTSLISKMWDIVNDYRDPSRSLQRIFREELMEAKTERRGEELELMTAQLFDGQQVQQAVQKALTSLEATRRSQQSLAVRWAEVSSSVENTEVHDALTEKLEELDQGLNLAEASTRWFREPDQNTAQHLAGLTSQEELAWLGDLSRSLGSRCGQLRASAKVLEACQEGGKAGGSMTAVERFLGDLPTVLNEDVLKSGQHFAARMKRLLAKRHALQDELLETWSRRMSVHEEQSHAECVSEGLGSLIYLLEDNELKETPQEDVTPAELLNILHSTAARVFKHRKSQVFDWAMMGLSDMDHMVAEAVTSEQARVPIDVQVAVSQLEVDSKDLLQDDRRNFDIHLLQQSVLESLEPPNDLLQSMEELAAAMDSSTIHVARGNVEELPAKPSESDEVSKPSPARPGSLPLDAPGGLALPQISEADVVGHEVLDAEQPGPDTTPSRPSTDRRPSSQLQPAGQTSETLIDQAPSDAKPHGVQRRETRELEVPAEGLSEAIGPSRDDPSRTAESARPSSSSNQPQHPTPGMSAVTVTQPLPEVSVAEAVEDVAADVAPLRPHEGISSRSATVQEPEMREEHRPEGEDFTQILAELETPAVVSPKGDNVEVPASEVLSTNQSALADSDKSLSDVPVPSVTEGKLDQQAMIGLSDMDQVVAEALTSEVARVPTNVQVAESQLEDSKELLDDRPESLEPLNNLVQSMEEVPLPATDSGPTGLHVKESPAIPRESDEEATKPPASRRGSSPPAPIGSSLDLPGSLEADVVDEVLDVQVAGTDTTPSRSSTGIRPSSQLQPAGQTSVDLIDQAPSDPAKLDSVQSHVADARENHELQLQAEGMIEAFESRDRPGGPGVAESARLRPSSSTHQPQDLTPRTPGTSPTSAVTVTLPLAAEMDVAEEDIAEAVKNVATHFASMPVAPVTPVNGESLLPASSPTTTAPQTSVKALAAILSPKSATTTPKAKGRRRRPRAMTRLGKEFDASDEEADFPGDDRTPAEGDHVEVPIASEDASGSLHPQRVLQTNQSALADSEKSLSDVPVPSVTEGKLNQQVHFWQMSSHTVATASHLSNTSNAREEDLEARENNKEKVAILSELGVNLGKHARSTTTPTSPHQRADSVDSVEAMRIKEAEGPISPNGSDVFPPISPKEGLARAQTDAIAGRRGRSLLAGDDDPMIERRRSSFDVIDTGVLVAIGRNTRELQKEDEEYVQEPSRAWMESIQSTEENLMKPQGRPSGHARHPELNVPSGTEQPMVSILSLEAEGHGASSKGRPRGLKGSMPRRGAPKFVRDKGKRSSGRPEENPLEWGATPVAATATVSIQEEPHEDAKDLEQQRPEVPGIDEAPAESEDVEMPIATNEVDEVLDERFEADRPSSAVSEEPQAVPLQEREDADHAVLARHPSKTAVGKLYRQASKGSKMDMLLHSRSFRSSTSLNLSEPDVGNDVEVDVEMDVDDVDVEAEAERKRETAARRWKLGGLAIQAVLRLRETIHSPNPPGSRRNSFNRSKILVQHQEAVLPNVPAVPGSSLPSPSSPSGTFSERGPGPSSTDAAAKPVASDVSETGSRDVIVAPKLPQVPSQVVGREDVTALVRRTSITPRAALPAQGAMKQMQVTVPSIALSHATATTTAAAATAATPRLPPAPAPPKTAVRQNGLGDMTAKSSLDRGDNLTLTAATIQAVRSLDAPYLGGFGKSEQRLLSAHTQSTQLSHDDSHLTLSKDSAYSSAGFSPYTSQTELHKMSSTNLSYQSSVAKFSIDSREKDELKEENFENLDVTEATQESTTSALPLLDRRSYGVETALVTPTGKLLGSPGCWNGGLSKEVGEVYMAHAGHVLEMRSLPHVPGKFKKTAVKVTKAPTPKLVLTNLAKPKKKRQLIQATTPRAGGAKATGASREALRPKLYTRGHRLADRNVEVTEAS